MSYSFYGTKLATLIYLGKEYKVLDVSLPDTYYEKINQFYKTNLPNFYCSAPWTIKEQIFEVDNDKQLWFISYKLKLDSFSNDENLMENIFGSNKIFLHDINSTIDLEISYTKLEEASQFEVLQLEIKNGIVISTKEVTKILNGGIHKLKSYIED